MMAVTVAFVAAVAAFWLRVWEMGPATRVAAAMMVAGSVGNFIDRARLGRVIDFIEMPMIPMFQVFNLADAFLVLGTAVLIYSMLRAS
ncbi:MAG TPA: signal peptidase II [Bacillota bacterium]|nr:signal peptidase II [Bacillota bacterium]